MPSRDRFALHRLRKARLPLHDVLGGGGIASLRYDPQGKTYGLWYNRYRYDCVEVEANDGRIRRIDRARRSACE